MPHMQRDNLRVRQYPSVSQIQEERDKRKHEVHVRQIEFCP